MPHSEEEALKAAGIVPSDTESLLRAQGKVGRHASSRSWVMPSYRHRTAVLLSRTWRAACCRG